MSMTPLAMAPLTLDPRTELDGTRCLGTRGSGLSLGDRLCLALGLRLDLPVATADAMWEWLDSGPEVVVIR
jgi:ribonuclease VapC